MPKNDTIFKRLRKATDSELNQIVSSLKLSTDRLPTSRKAKFEEISRTYRKAAGNSFISPFRDAHSLAYKQILIDVADKLSPKLTGTKYTLTDSFTEVEIENYILEILNDKLKKKLKGLSEEERRKKAKELEDKLKKNANVHPLVAKQAVAVIVAGGAGAYLAAPAAIAFYYGGFWWGAYAAIFGAGGGYVATAGAVIAAPIAVGAASLLVSTPAYRKTIPTTINFIMIRHRIEIENELD